MIYMPLKWTIIRLGGNSNYFAVCCEVNKHTTIIHVTNFSTTVVSTAAQKHKQSFMELFTRSFHCTKTFNVFERTKFIALRWKEWIAASWIWVFVIKNSHGRHVIDVTWQMSNSHRRHRRLPSCGTLSCARKSYNIHTHSPFLDFFNVSVYCCTIWNHGTL